MPTNPSSVAITRPVRPMRTLSVLLAVLAGGLAGMTAAGMRWAPLAGATAVASLLIAWGIQQWGRITALSVERTCCWLAFTAGFFGVALFAVDVGPFVLFPFRAFLLLLWVLLLARSLVVPHPLKLPLRPVRFYLLFLVAWLGYSVLSVAWAMSLVDAARHVIFLLMGVSVILFVAFYFSGEPDQRRLFWIWLGVFGLLLVLGVWEHVTGQHLPVSGYYGETRARFMFRPTGVFRNPNDYASYLALSIPFALSLARYARTVLLRLMGVGSAIIGAYLILAAGSRGNLVAVLACVAFMWLFLARGVRRVKWAVIAIVLTSGLLLLAPGVTRQIFGSAGERIASIVLDAPREGGSTDVRWNLLKNGLLFVHSTGGMGVGAGNAEYWMANFARHDTFGILNPHNWWLEILINYGIFLFAAYVVFYISLIRGLLRAWARTEGTQRMICEALILSLVGFAVASMSPSSVMAWTPQWMLFAAAVAFLNGWRSSQARGTLR